MKKVLLPATWLVSLVVCGGLGWKMGASSVRTAPVASSSSRSILPAVPPWPVGAKPAELPSTDIATLAASVVEAAKLPPDSPEFASAVRKVLDDPNKRRRLATWYALLENLTPAHLAAIVPRIRENDVRGAGSGSEWSALWEVWGSKDGADAIDFIKAFDWTDWHHQSRSGALYSSMGGWGRGDGAAAAEWWAKDGNGAGDLCSALVAGWATSDPEAAAAWAAQNNVLGSMDPIFDEMARRGGMERVEAWMKSQPPDSAAAGVAAEELGRGRLRENFASGVDWVVQHQDEPWNAGGSRALTLVRELADKSLPRAMELAHQLHDTEPASQVMKYWVSRNAVEASEWLRSNAKSPQYDTAAAALAEAIQPQDPASARDWAASIRNEKTREEVLARLGGR